MLTWRMKLGARCAYERDRAHRRLRLLARRCPECPRPLTGPHKFGCHYGRSWSSPPGRAAAYLHRKV